MSDRSTLPVCRCGHNRRSHWARAEMKYGVGAWLMLFNGASARPRRITFRCGHCREVIETTSDPAVLESHRRR